MLTHLFITHNRLFLSNNHGHWISRAVNRKWGNSREYSQENQTWLHPLTHFNPNFSMTYKTKRRHWKRGMVTRNQIVRKKTSDGSAWKIHIISYHLYGEVYHHCKRKSKTLIKGTKNLLIQHQVEIHDCL